MTQAPATRNPNCCRSGETPARQAATKSSRRPRVVVEMRSCDGIAPPLRFCLLSTPRRRRAVNRGRPRRRSGEKCEAGTVEEAGMYPLTDTFIFQAPTNITFGPGAIGQLGQIVAPLGQRPLGGRDPGIAAAGLLQQVRDALGP